MSKGTGRRKVSRSRRYTTDAGWALAHTVPMQKHLMPLLGLSKGKISEICNGKRPTFVDRYLELVQAAVREERADAGHLVASSLLTSEQAAAELPVAEIVRRLLDRLAQETVLQAEEDVAEQRLAVALGVFVADEEPTDERLAELRDALEAHDDAVRLEMGREVDCIYYNRALQVKCGWRRLP